MAGKSKSGSDDLRNIEDDVKEQAAEPTPGPTAAPANAEGSDEPGQDPGPRPAPAVENVKGPKNEKMDAPAEIVGTNRRSSFAAPKPDDAERERQQEETRQQVLNEGRNQNTSMGRNSDNDQ